MKYSLIIACLLSGCDNTPSYEQLVNYPSQCSKADEQLKELRSIQQRKGFDSDPDKLNESDRAYNSRLKATIWWYAYKCNKS